jgi:hypothetical protein
VDEVSALEGVEAGFAGFGLGGPEAAFGEGSEGAGSLKFEDLGAAFDGAGGKRWQGDIVEDYLVCIGFGNPCI